MGRGTTSACAENTFFVASCDMNRRNYLRVRGEYLLPFCLGIMSMELPPRARRIRCMIFRPCLIQGTTSACAENTDDESYLFLDIGNYLRVRGEYGEIRLRDIENLELPPRARRIPSPHQFRMPRRGTTSACAENTIGRTPWFQRHRNYLRVRGEYPRVRKP